MKPYKNIDEYIENFPKETQERMQILRNAIKDAAPEAEETIAYMMPAFKINGKGIAYFGGFKNHIGFYPFPSGIRMFKELSSDFVTSKGTIQFPHSKPIPVDLVKKIIQFRVRENSEKAMTR